MAPNEQARKNHDELFPGHVSTLAVTDPELIEYFDNFAFDEVLRHGNLDTRTRLMVQLAALIACQALSEYRVMLGAALTVGVTPVEVKEIVYQAVPYVGMGKVFDFLHATNDVLTDRGVELPLQGQSTTTPETRAEKGLAVQKQIVGDERVDAMYADRARRRDAHPAVPVGELLRRPPTPAPASTFRPANCSPSPCSSRIGGCEPQVKGHVAGQPQRRQRPRPLLERRSPSCCRSSATPAPSTRSGSSTMSSRPEHENGTPSTRTHRRLGQHAVPGHHDVR